MAIAPVLYPMGSAVVLAANTLSEFSPNTQFRGTIAVITVSAASGTNPALLATMQSSGPYDEIFDLPGANFAPINATGTYTLFLYPGVAHIPNHIVPIYVPGNIRFSFRVLGTTPSFTVSYGLIMIE